MEDLPPPILSDILALATSDSKTTARAAAQVCRQWRDDIWNQLDRLQTRTPEQLCSAGRLAPQVQTLVLLGRQFMDEKVVESELGKFRKLKGLKLKAVALRKVPDLRDVPWAPQLRKIRLDGTFMVFPGFLALTCLQALESLAVDNLNTLMPGCGAVDVRSLSCLHKLTALKLRDFGNFRLEGLSELTGLHAFDFSAHMNSSVREGWLPLDLATQCGQLGNLRKLDLGDKSPYRPRLPCGFLTSLHGLESLALSRFSLPDQLQGLRSLSRLQTLCLEGSPTLSMLPQLGPKVRFLCLDDLPRLERLPTLARVAQLRELVLVDVPVRKLPDLGLLTVLEYLEVTCCGRLTTLMGLENLSALQTLVVHHATKLPRIPSLAALGSLTKLSLESCPRLDEVPGLSDLRQLRSLHLKDLNLKATNLSRLTSMTSCSICGCGPARTADEVTAAWALKGLDSLVQLHLYCAADS